MPVITSQPLPAQVHPGYAVPPLVGPAAPHVDEGANELQQDLTVSHRERSYYYGKYVFCAVIGGSLLCYPCAVARLFGHCTGCYNPMDVTLCGTRCSIPGLEHCSTRTCRSHARDYSNCSYTRVGESGLEPRALDVITIATAHFIMAGALSSVIGLYLKA